MTIDRITEHQQNRNRFTRIEDALITGLRSFKYKELDDILANDPDALDRFHGAHPLNEALWVFIDDSNQKRELSDLELDAGAIKNLLAHLKEKLGLEALVNVLTISAAPLADKTERKYGQLSCIDLLKSCSRSYEVAVLSNYLDDVIEPEYKKQQIALLRKSTDGKFDPNKLAVKGLRGGI